MKNTYRVTSYAMGRVLASRDVRAASASEAGRLAARELPAGGTNAQGKKIQVLGVRVVR
jgi:hypothetical protein